MRQRFRVKNRLFAAETFASGKHFEVKVFSLHPGDSYYKREGQKPLLCLRGTNEPDLLRQAISHTRRLLEEKPTQ